MSLRSLPSIDFKKYIPIFILNFLSKLKYLFKKISPVVLFLTVIFFWGILFTAVLDGDFSSSEQPVNTASRDIVFTKEMIHSILDNLNAQLERVGILFTTNVVQEKTTEGITRMNDISAIYNFAAHSNNIRANGLVWLGKNLYSFNSENNAIYKYDLTQKTGEIMVVNSQDIGHLKIAKTGNNGIVFLTDLPGIASYEPFKSDIKKLSIQFAEGESDIADITVYKQNFSLYTLSKADSQIYKHLSIAAGYTTGIKWLKDPEGSPFNNPISLTIDGDIYVLQNDSTNPIIKLTNGLSVKFSIPNMSIPLNKATKITTESGFENLYILDPKNKRVVVITKNGNYTEQFISEKFDNLIDIAVSPNEKEIYVLSGTFVYEIAL